MVKRNWKVMKSYTDIKQSAQLALLLPTGSSDMWWSWFSNPLDDTNGGEYEKDPLLHKPICNPEKAIPCWSLAALIEMLPTIDDGNRNPIFCKDIRFNKWHVVYHGTAVEPTIDSGLYNNLIDACYELIARLHEQKLL